ncbi:MAG: class I SAM-dependent methyltransferase [Candidatus Humimicrobiia bacterium]
MISSYLSKCRRIKDINSNDLGIFVLSMSTLALQALFIRLFSISLWYHFAFMIVSIALLGFGASGTYLSMFLKNNTNNEDQENEKRGLLKNKYYLSRFSFLFSLTTILSYLIFNLVPFDPYRIAFDKIQFLYLFIWYLGLTAPFFFSGVCLGILLSQKSEKVHIVYFYNLVGSSIGSFFVVLTIPIFGGEKLVLLIACFGIIASFLFLPKYQTDFSNYKNLFTKLSSIFTKFKNRFILVNIFSLILIITLIIFTPKFFKIRMAPQKTLSQLLNFPDSKILLTEWNAFSKVDVIESDKIHSAPGLSLKFPDPPPKQIGITTDGDDLSPITFCDNTKNTTDFLYYLPSYIAYILKPNSNVVLMNPGGGLDILSALQNNCKKITIVEKNPILINLLKEEYRDFNGNVLNSSKVKVINENDRNFIASSKKKYDLIFLCLDDSYKVVTAGTYSLGENYEYTVEAIKQYYNHLEINGILCISRWLQLPPSESLKIFSTILSSLDELNIKDPQDYVCAIRSFSTSFIMVKNGKFSNEEKQGVKDFCDERGFDLIYYSNIMPDETNKNIKINKPYYYECFSKIIGIDKEDFINEYEFDVSPTTDNKPFFFHFFKPSHIPKILASYGKTWQPFGGGGYLILFALLLISVLLSIMLIIIPLIIRSKRFNLKVYKWQIFVYFFAIGVGYLFIEIPLMQKFILYLGHPIYSVSTVLFSILFFSGLGSLILGKNTQYFSIKICALLILILILLMLSPVLLKNLMAYPFYIRFISCILILAPIGFLMGVPFPMGIRLTSKVSSDLIPWAWSVNGFSSVVSSILATIFTIFWGFNTVLIMAFFAYLLALISFIILKLYLK